MTPFNVFRRNLTATRVTTGGFGANGLALPPTEVTTTIRASVQPLTGKDLETLPENRRDIESYLLYCDATLDTLDRVTINGAQFEIQGRETWGNNIINHNVYLAQKVMG